MLLLFISNPHNMAMFQRTLVGYTCSFIVWAPWLTGDIVGYFLLYSLNTEHHANGN